jgi:hypothetical protein
MNDITVGPEYVVDADGDEATFSAVLKIQDM